MRESLTIFAIAVILVLSALLVGPYLIDWNGQRDWLAAKLSTAVGARVRIAGPIDVKVLPRPIFRAANVSIEGGTPQDPRFAADRLDAELSLNGLLQGSIEFVDAHMTAPRITLTMRQDGSLAGPPLDVTNPQKIQFQRLSIANGTVAVLDDTGAKRLELSGVEADGQAETLFGPLKLNGSAETTQGPVQFRLNTGAFSGRRLRTHLVVDHSGLWTHADADGTLSLGAQGGSKPRHTSVAFEGNLSLSGELLVADNAAPVPWSLVATGNNADLQNLAAPALEVRAGADGRAFVANGSALVSLSGQPAAIAKFRSRQLDLDHLATPSDAAPKAMRPNASQWLAALRAALGGSVPLPIGLKLDVGVDAVTSGDLTLTDASARVEVRPGSLPQIALAFAGPNSTRAAFDGMLEVGITPDFKGKVDLATRDLAAVADWLKPVWPGLDDALGTTARGTPVAFKGNVDVSPVGVVARDAVATLAGSDFEGTASYTAGLNGARPRVFADLGVGAFDVERWPSAGDLLAMSEPLDFVVALRSEAVTVARTDAGSPQSGRMTLHATKIGQAITLDQFGFTGLNGASVSGTGALDANKRLHAEGRADTNDIAPLAAALKGIAPGLVSDVFAARAAAFAPLQFSFKADAVLDSDAGLTPIGFSGTGTAAGTRFSATVAPTLHGGSSSPVDATIVLDAPEAARAFEQAGWHVPSDLGALHAELSGQGTLADGFETKVKATLPRAALSFDGRTSGPEGRGRITGQGSDAASLLGAAGLGSTLGKSDWTAAGDLSWSSAHASLHQISARFAGDTIGGDLDYARVISPDHPGAPALTGALKVEVVNAAALAALGLGASPSSAGRTPQGWSSTPFGPAAAWPGSDLALQIGRLEFWPGFAGQDVGLKLVNHSGAVTLADMSGHLLGGTAGGSLTLRRIGATASVAGQVSFDKLSLSLPSLVGRLSGTLNLAGTGQSPAALTSSLAGDGSVTLSDASLPRLDPGALGRTAAKFNAEGTTPDDATVRDELGRQLDRGPVRFGDTTAPATVAAGVLRVAGVKTAVPDAAVVADAAFDLADLTLSLRTSLTGTTLPPEWKGDPPQVDVTWKGPLTMPQRDINAASFVNGLAARAIAREQERIELMKDDLRERAFFARRLKQIEADQQAARDAALAKSVPQPPSRPTDIRLPKPPDVGTPMIQRSAKPSDSNAELDGITKLLESQSSNQGSQTRTPASPAVSAPGVRPNSLPPAAPSPGSLY